MTRVGGGFQADLGTALGVKRGLEVEVGGSAPLQPGIQLRRNRMTRIGMSLLLVLCLFPAVLAQPHVKGPIVIPAARHDTSLPMRELMRGVPPVRDTGRQQALEMEEPPARHIPPAFDPVRQSSRGTAQQAQIVMSFEGITQGGAVPPDTNGAPGINSQYVQTTNFLYAVFDKSTGNITFGPYFVKSLFQGFGGQCETEDAMSDPTVRFDRSAGRWIIQQIAGEYSFTPPLFICLAVSTTSDATGAYYRYAIPYGNYLPDYPKLSVWPDAYYLTADLYLNWVFQATSACALDRSSMLQGGPASAICFQTGSDVFHFLPADLDGAVPPPRGAPNFIVGNVSGSNHALDLFKFHVDFINPQKCPRGRRLPGGPRRGVARKAWPRSRGRRQRALRLLRLGPWLPGRASRQSLRRARQCRQES